MLSIQSNMLAQNACRQLNVTTKKKAKNTEKLSSGYKLNRAADDAAGLSMSEKMRRQIRGLHQGAENIQDGVGFVQTADSALNEAQEILQRINELSVKSANGTNNEEDRYYIDREIQELKAELSRIFSTTTYNERKIWDGKDHKLLGYEKKQAVEFGSKSTTFDVTNDNCGVIASGGYQIHADKEQGVSISWIGYDGEHYQTEPISWEQLKNNGYSFNMSDYFGTATEDNKLYDAAGQPVFDNLISFSVQPSATIDDIITCIDGRTFSSYAYAHMSGGFEDKSGASVPYGDSVSITSVSLNYSAAYASNRNTGKGDNSDTQNSYDFDRADDDFLIPTDSRGTRDASVQEPSASKGNLTTKPSATSVSDAKSSNESWTFSFYMDGIGKVTASTSYVSYYAPYDRDDDDENYWWHWESATVNGKYIEHYRKVSTRRYVSPNLGGVMDALTGRKGDSTPGLLSYDNGGEADGGGIIEIDFSLRSEDSFTYGNNVSSNSVGSFTIRISVSNSDTEESILKKIQDALNDDTILDFQTTGGTSANTTIGQPTAKRNPIDVPVYGSTCGFFVESGPEAGEHIGIQYDALSLWSIGLQHTNVLTVTDANRAIEEVKKGLQIVSEQRATFGAYQNRLEHAYNINLNSEENTQYAESEIRDTDIAKTMVEYANQNILSQASNSLLAQANQQPNYMLQLLR